MAASPASNLAPVRQAAVATLEWGFRVAAVLLGLGTVISLARQQPLAEELPQVADILREVGDLEGTGFFGLGIFAIILTPVITTLMIAVSFYRQGERRHATWTLVVLVILAISIAWSQR